MNDNVQMSEEEIRRDRELWDRVYRAAQVVPILGYSRIHRRIPFMTDLDERGGFVIDLRDRCDA